MTDISAFFRANGTKLIGYLTLAAGFIATADPALIDELLGAKWQRWALLIVGLATAIRGHTNTAAIKDDIRVEEKAKEQVKVENAVLDIQTKRESP